MYIKTKRKGGWKELVPRDLIVPPPEQSLFWHRTAADIARSKAVHDRWRALFKIEDGRNSLDLDGFYQE